MNELRLCLFSNLMLVYYIGICSVDFPLFHISLVLTFLKSYRENTNFRIMIFTIFVFASTFNATHSVWSQLFNTTNDF